MWVFTRHGFYSAVQASDDPKVIVIRARARIDLERLLEFSSLQEYKAEITYGEGTDYPFRVRLNRETWSIIIADVAQDIDYGNFKDAVKAEQGKKVADIYMRVWSALLALEPRQWKQRFWREPEAPELPVLGQPTQPLNVWEAQSLVPDDDDEVVRAHTRRGRKVRSHLRKRRAG